MSIKETFAEQTVLMTEEDDETEGLQEYTDDALNEDAAAALGPVQDLNPNSGSGVSLNYVGQDISGILSKWTNYIHGWQDRFFVLKDGNLSYYKSEQDLQFGCRGSISVLRAAIRPHDLDECRFDVSVNDCCWYLRVENSEEKLKWLEVLERYKAESGYGSQNNLKRNGSAMSVSSNTLSGVSSGSSFYKDHQHELKVKLGELETYRDILTHQIDNLQKYFDACAISSAGKNKEGAGDLQARIISANESEDSMREDLTLSLTGAMKASKGANNLSTEVSGFDFRGESFTFKATTTAVLAAISHCIDIMLQREETWRKRLETEIEKKKKAEEYFKEALRDAQIHSKILFGPDCEEGPHSSLKEDEFYDAVELGLDRMEEEHEFSEKLKAFNAVQPAVAQAIHHPLWSEIDKITLEQLHYAKLGVGHGGWELFAEDGEMKMYKREEEIDGLVVDPLKAVHTVKRFTAHEICHYFFSPEFRMEWESKLGLILHRFEPKMLQMMSTLEKMTILERISDDTIIFQQIHKRIWPATQRDALFWSHIREVRYECQSEAVKGSTWVVCNHSTEHSKDLHPPSATKRDKPGKYIRIYLTVSLVCQTVIDPPLNGGPITRDNLTCHINYCAVVNPGGWAPASALRAVYKREYPRFLKTFTKYVLEKCKDQPIMF